MDWYCSFPLQKWQTALREAFEDYRNMQGFPPTRLLLSPGCTPPQALLNEAQALGLETDYSPLVFSGEAWVGGTVTSPISHLPSEETPCPENP